MPGLNFQARFADAVKSGRKKRTIRAIRQRPIVVGDKLCLMTGQRQKGKYRPLGEARCRSVEPIVIRPWDGVIQRGEKRVQLSQDAILAFAWADGFKSRREFFEWFSKQWGERFEGVLIQW